MLARKRKGERASEREIERKAERAGRERGRKEEKRVKQIERGKEYKSYLSSICDLV